MAKIYEKVYHIAEEVFGGAKDVCGSIVKAVTNTISG